MDIKTLWLLRELNLDYDDNEHKYLINGIKFISVTTLIEHAFLKFDDKEMINKMKNNGNLEKYYPDKSEEYICELWENNAEIASSFGTKIHKKIEILLSYMAMEGLDDFSTFNTNYLPLRELQIFYSWFEFSDLVPVKLEMKIYDEEYQVAGTFDALFRDSNGNYILIDWKVCDEISSISYQKSIIEGVDIPDCKLGKYSLQLSIYRFILEKNYGIKIHKTFIGKVFPFSLDNPLKKEINEHKNIVKKNHSPFELIETIYYENEARLVLEYNIHTLLNVEHSV